MEFALHNRLLLVSPDFDLAYAVTEALESFSGGEGEWKLALAAATFEAELLACDAPYEAALLDWRFLDNNPFPMLQRLKALMPGTALVAVIPDDDGKGALQAMRAGAAAVIHGLNPRPQALRRALEACRRKGRDDMGEAVRLSWTSFMQLAEFNLKSGAFGSGAFLKVKIAEPLNASIEELERLSARVLDTLQRGLGSLHMASEARPLEFGMLLPDGGDWARLCARIHEAIPALGNWTRHYPCASIGVSVFQGQGSAAALASRARVAMKRAQLMGGGCTQVFSPLLQAELDRRMQRELDLRKALAREELQLKFLALDGALEAVADDAGNLAALAHESGLTFEWVQWMLHRCARELHGMQLRQGASARALIRLSREQLMTPGLSEEFSFAAAAWDLEPGTLGFLVSGSDWPEARTALLHLADAGAALANIPALSPLAMAA